MADLLFDSFRTSKKSLEISDGNWAYLEDEMLSFLGINRMQSPVVIPKNGIYMNEALGFVIKVDGMSIIDPNKNTRRLFLKTCNEFYVDWLPTTLHFEDNRIIISGSQVVDHWTATGMIYEKVVL